MNYLQDCAEGFMRVFNKQGVAMCKPCNCNNKTEVCDVNTGKCLVSFVVNKFVFLEYLKFFDVQ